MYQIFITEVKVDKVKVDKLFLLKIIEAFINPFIFSNDKIKSGK